MFKRLISVILFQLNFIVLIANSDSTLLKINQQLIAFESNKKDIQFLHNANQYNFQLLKFKPEKSLDISKKIIQNSKISGFKIPEIEAIRIQALANNILGKNDSVLLLFQKAFSLSEEIRNDSLCAKITNNIGSYYLKSSEYNLAIENYFKALHFAFRSNSVRTIASIANNIALIYESDRYYDFKKASFYYYLSLSKRLKINDLSDIASSYRSLALLNVKENKLEIASYFLKKSISISKQINDTQGLAMSLVSLAKIQINKSKTEEGNILNVNALILANNERDLYKKAWVYGEVGKNYAQLGMYQEALDALKHAELNYSTLQHDEFQAELNEKIADIYLKINQPDSALFFTKKAIKYLEKQKIKDSKKEINLIEKEYHSKLQKEILNNEINYEKKQKYFLIINFIFLCLAGGTIIWNIKKSENNLKTINSELVKAEEESNKFKKDLEKLNEELSLMVAKRTKEIEKLYSDQKTYIFHHNHQLRRPLTNILGICEVLKKDRKLYMENKILFDALQNNAQELNKISLEMNDFLTKTGLNNG